MAQRFRPSVPKRRDWLRGFLVALAVAIGLYLLVAWRRPWQPGGFWGLTYGTIAALLFLKDGLYPLRRRLLARPFGSAQNWLQLHIYGGSAAAILVVLHTGARWPGGSLGWWLLGLTVFAGLSGLVGVAVQKWVPALLSRQLRVEAQLQRIPELVARLIPEADELIKGASRSLIDFYQAKARPVLLAPLSWRTAFGGIAGGSSLLDNEFRSIELRLGTEEKQKLADLRSIVGEKLELDLQYSLQSLSRMWLWFHVPPCYVLLALVLWHIVTVWQY